MIKIGDFNELVTTFQELKNLLQQYHESDYESQYFDYKPLLTYTNKLCRGVEKKNTAEVLKAWSYFDGYLSHRHTPSTNFIEDVFVIFDKLRVLGFLDPNAKPHHFMDLSDDWENLIN